MWMASSFERVMLSERRDAIQQRESNIMRRRSVVGAEKLPLVDILTWATGAAVFDEQMRRTHLVYRNHTTKVTFRL